MGAERWEDGIGAQILADLDVRRVRLLSDGREGPSGLDGLGCEVVERVPLPPVAALPS